MCVRVAVRAVDGGAGDHRAPDEWHEVAGRHGGARLRGPQPHVPEGADRPRCTGTHYNTLISLSPSLSFFFSVFLSFLVFFIAVCLCVRERDRERNIVGFPLSVCVCVCAGLIRQHMVIWLVV